MKKYWIYVIVAVVVLALGIGVYMYTKKDTPKLPAEKPKTPDTATTPILPSTSNSFANSKSKDKQRIIEVQKFINGLGYNPKLTEDGSWGPKTQEAVQSVFATAEISEAQWTNRSNSASNWKNRGPYAPTSQSGNPTLDKMLNFGQKTPTY